MGNSIKYQSVASNVQTLGSVIPTQLVEDTTKALSKLKVALGSDVSGYVANRLHMDMAELSDALASEQVEGVALAMYNIEKRAQSIIIGDQTGIGKGRQAAAMIRYGLLSGYLPIFFTERYTLFSDIYRDCKALGIKDARPLIVNTGVSVVDFDHIIEEKDTDNLDDEIWSPTDDEEVRHDAELMQLYQKQYKVVYQSPKKRVLQTIFDSGDIPSENYDYLMITYSQLKDAKRDTARLDFLQSLCERHRVLFIFDEAHRSSSVCAGKVSVITQGINRILTETTQTQCVFLSATFAKRPESLITFMRRTALSALATEHTLEKALRSGGVPMQEYVSSTLAAEGQMIRREHSNEGIPVPIYTYLDDDLALHSELFDKVMYYFREIVKLSAMVQAVVNTGQSQGVLENFRCYPVRTQLFYINKVLLLSLKAQRVAQTAIDNVKQGCSVVIGMSDTLECILRDVKVLENDVVRGDMSVLLLRLLDKTIRNSDEHAGVGIPLFDYIDDKVSEMPILLATVDEVKTYYKYIAQSIKDETFHLPASPIDIIRQLISQESFVAPDGTCTNIRFEECTGRVHQLEYLSPEGDDDYANATIVPRKKRHSNHIFNDFQNNKIDVILINACGAIGASAHAVATTEVPDEQVRQRKMLIVQNDLDVNIDLQKRGRINRTGQRTDLPPLYEYIITAIPSEKRLNMMLRAKLRSLSANTAAYQDQDKAQADFIDISNKYGNEVAMDYINEHKELALVLGLKGKVTASKLLARIAMLSVNAQQDIVDEIMTAYTTLEEELRRINQWDLEREFRDFEAEFVREELFSTAKADTRLGGCSYLTSYRCRQKTFPYTYERLQEICDEAKVKFDISYKDNNALQSEIRDYYIRQNRLVRQRLAERKKLLYVDAERILINYCQNKALADKWLEAAQAPYEQWDESEMSDVGNQKKAKQILRKLISYSNDYNHLLDRAKDELKKYAAEKKRLVEILSKAAIGKGYSNISSQIASEECPDRVIAVLTDIRFGKEDRNRFLPSRVEFVFALTAVYTEIRINMVHNNKWSNYERLQEIMNSAVWRTNAAMWNKEIAMNNNRVVERKIITGNILGAFVHPAIAQLKPRFITFSLKDNAVGKSFIQNGLLLPMNEAKIREVLKTVSVPLHEGVRYANNPETSYPITGVGVDFSLLPFRTSDDRIDFVISVEDKDSKLFEEDHRFDVIRGYFKGRAVSSVYQKHADDKKKRKLLMHYASSQLEFASEALQSILQTLVQLDAVIIVPRDQITNGEAKDFISQSERDDNKAWSVLDWQNADTVPMPPIREKLLLRISAPVLPPAAKGTPVFRHTPVYLLAKATMELSGQSLKDRNTLHTLRRIYMRWRELPIQGEDRKKVPLVTQKEIYHNLRAVIENQKKEELVAFYPNVRDVLQRVLDSEHLNANGLFVNRFENEMLFLSPEIDRAQAFLDELPCSSHLSGIRECIQDYIDGKTDIINSPDGF